MPAICLSWPTIFWLFAAACIIILQLFIKYTQIVIDHRAGAAAESEGEGEGRFGLARTRLRVTAGQAHMLAGVLAGQLMNFSLVGVVSQSAQPPTRLARPSRPLRPSP